MDPNSCPIGEEIPIYQPTLNRVAVYAPSQDTITNSFACASAASNRSSNRSADNLRRPARISKRAQSTTDARGVPPSCLSKQMSQFSPVEPRRWGVLRWIFDQGRRLAYKRRGDVEDEEGVELPSLLGSHESALDAAATNPPLSLVDTITDGQFNTSR
ncbi:hypothetical protein HJFPF1_08060 [Paramyrothecium foliicola]|nr:hypothetical protein HJFPF1_08060 [Paramyrothecium foliicola]